MSEEVVHQLRELGEDVDLLRLAEHYRVEALKTRRALRRVFERVNKRELLSGAVGAWLQVAEEARKRRREGLFEALGGQLQAVKRRCTAWEGVLYSRPAILEAFSNWRMHCRNRRRRGHGPQTALRLAEASRSICLLRVLASWRSSCFRDAKRRTTLGASGEPPARSRSASSTPVRRRQRPTFSLSTNLSGGPKDLVARPPPSSSSSSACLRSRFESVGDGTPVKNTRVQPGALAASPAGPASEVSPAQGLHKAEGHSRQMSGCPDKPAQFHHLPQSQESIPHEQPWHQEAFHRPLHQHHHHPRFFGPVPVLDLADSSTHQAPPPDGNENNDNDGAGDGHGQSSSRIAGVDSSGILDVGASVDGSDCIASRADEVEQGQQQGYCCAPFDILDDDSTRHTETPDNTEEAGMLADAAPDAAPAGAIGGPLAISFADFLKGHLAEDPEVQVLHEDMEDLGEASPSNASELDDFGEDNAHDREEDLGAYDEHEEDEDFEEGDYDDYEGACELEFQSPSVSSSTMVFERLDAEADLAMQRVESSPATSIGSASRATLLSARRHEAAQRRLTKSATFGPGARPLGGRSGAAVPKARASKPAARPGRQQRGRGERGAVGEEARSAAAAAAAACSSAPPLSSSPTAVEKASDHDGSFDDDHVPKRKGGTSVFSRLQDPSHYTGCARYGGPSLKDTAVGNAKDSLSRWAGDLRDTSKRRASLPGMIYGVGMGREASLASLGKSEGGCRTPGSAHRNILSSASIGSSMSVGGGNGGAMGQANSGLSSQTPR